MNTRDILSAIDAEIARLQSARSLLAGTAWKRRGRAAHIHVAYCSEEENDVSSRKEEDRRGTAQALGKAESGIEVTGQRTK
jgi:hypothetical protein